MHRRALLVAVAGLSGCTGIVSNPFADDPEPAREPSIGGDDSTDAGGADDETATVTATPAEPTPAETPSAADLRGLSVTELLSRAREQIDAAVSAYAGDGDPLTAVSARSDTFDPAPVVGHLYRARQAYEAANRQGISAEQEATIRQLRRIDGAIRLLIDGQVLLIETHGDLEEIATAIRLVEPETTTSLTNRVSSRQQRIKETGSELTSPRYAQSMGAVESLSKAAFVAKRQQLAAETAVVDGIDDAFPSVLEGVRLFAQAQRKRSSGAPYAAASLSRDAAVVLNRGVNDLSAAAASITPRSQGFTSVTNELVSVTRTQRDAARAFADSIERTD